MKFLAILLLISISGVLLRKLKTKNLDTHELLLSPEENHKNPILKQYKQELKKYIHNLGGHRGDVLEHSQWSAIQVMQWLEKPNENVMAKDVDKNTAIITSWIHDIGKGGDCEFKNYNNQNKYPLLNGKPNDNYHPIYSGDIIMGKRPFKICPDKGKVINIKDLVTSLDPKVDIKQVAFCSYMHWEFGRINSNLPKVKLTEAEVGDKDIKPFYDKVKEYLPFVPGLKPSKNLIKLCIAVACADIAAASDIRVKSNMQAMKSPHPERSGKSEADPWQRFFLHENYKLFRRKVIDYYETGMKDYKS